MPKAGRSWVSLARVTSSAAAPRLRNSGLTARARPGLAQQCFRQSRHRPNRGEEVGLALICRVQHAPRFCRFWSDCRTLTRFSFSSCEKLVHFMLQCEIISYGLAVQGACHVQGRPDDQAAATTRPGRCGAGCYAAWRGSISRKSCCPPTIPRPAPNFCFCRRPFSCRPQPWRDQGLGHAGHRRISERDRARGRAVCPRRWRPRTHCRAVSGEMHSGFYNLRSALPMNLKAHYPGFKVWAGAQADIDRITADLARLPQGL